MTIIIVFWSTSNIKLKVLIYLIRKNRMKQNGLKTHIKLDKIQKQQQT